MHLPFYVFSDLVLIEAYRTYTIPFAKKYRPQYRFLSSRCISKILIALLPFMKHTASAIEYFGGTDKTKWIWSTWMLPSRISNFFHSHSCRIMSRIERPTSPCKILNRYFGHQTTRYLHSHTACANFLKRFIEYLLSFSVRRLFGFTLPV